MMKQEEREEIKNNVGVDFNFNCFLNLCFKP